LEKDTIQYLFPSCLYGKFEAGVSTLQFTFQIKETSLFFSLSTDQFEGDSHFCALAIYFLKTIQIIRGKFDENLNAFKSIILL
jgi:hypothetical protein